MRGLWTGAGVVTGAAIGLLVGQLVFDGEWWAPAVGAGIGLILGAAIEAFKSKST